MVVSDCTNLRVRHEVDMATGQLSCQSLAEHTVEHTQHLEYGDDQREQKRKEEHSTSTIQTKVESIKAKHSLSIPPLKAMRSEHATS